MKVHLQQEVHIAMKRLGGGSATLSDEDVLKFLEAYNAGRPVIFEGIASGRDP